MFELHQSYRGGTRIAALYFWVPRCDFFWSSKVFCVVAALKGDIQALFVIATTEVPLQPNIQANKKVTTSHLFNLKLCFARSSVAPGDRNHRPRITSDDRLERNLDGQIEVWRDERLTAFDRRSAVRLKRVSRIVERNFEKEAQKSVRQSIHLELEPWVVDHSAPFDEATSEYAIPTFIQCLPIPDNVPTIV